MRRLSWVISCLLFIIIPLTQFTAAQQNTLPTVNPSALTGELLVSNSSTLLPLYEQLSEQFIAEGYPGTFTNNAGTTSEAIESFCSTMTDIALTERLINIEEEDFCVANERIPIAFPIVSDALVVIVNASNDFAQDVTAGELQLLFSTANSWADVNSDWPSTPIQRYGPGTDSDTFRFFADIIFGGEARPMMTAIGAQYLNDVNNVLQGVGRDPNAIGFVSAQDLLNVDTVRTVPVNGIEATEENILNNSYDLSRPLYLYSAATVMQAQRQVAGFISYVITNAPSVAPRVGLFPPRQGDSTIAVNSWLNAVGSSGITQDPAQPISPPATSPTPTQEVLFDLTEEPFEEATEVVVAATATPAPLQEGAAILAAARNDVETMASDFIGFDRPDGWSGALDINNSELALLIRLDLELLARQVYGDTRPEDWFGAISSTQLAIAQDIRHDIEVVANTIYGMGERPLSWAGDDPLLSCDRNTRTLVELLEKSPDYSRPALNQDAPDYCERLATEISQYTEVNLLPENVQALIPSIASNVDPNALTSTRSTAPITGNVTIDTRFGVGFLDRSAAFKVGVIPEGELVVPIARSYTQFSNMLLIRGVGFVLFVDYLDTTLTREQFRDLPDVDVAGQETFCDPDWCNPF